MSANEMTAKVRELKELKAMCCSLRRAFLQGNARAYGARQERGNEGSPP